jgi:DNA-directed RNA polymerase subunit L
MEDAKMDIKISTTTDGRELTAELFKFPVGFVNAIRRILLSGIPTVVIRDVQILQNTTQLPHEMLKHRMEMLPVNVTPDESGIIKDAKIELRMPAVKADQVVTTDDFIVESGREGILMKDPEFETPCMFLKVRTGESVHITGRLAVEMEGVSQVETATTWWQVTPETAKEQRKLYIKEHPDDPSAGKYFDNFLVQRFYSRNEKGRPNLFGLKIVSIGVIKARDLLMMAVNILRKRLDQYITEALKNIKHEKDEGTSSISLDMGGHTIGVLLQEVIYEDEVQFVSYDIPHPLKPTMVLRLNSKKTAEKVLETAKKIIEEYCSAVENNNGAKSSV